MYNSEANPSTPLVSVCMVSYNQERFVREALDSVLMQKTTFPVEVIISDDCSIDSTLYILKEYKELYPNVVVLSGKENIGYPNNQRRSLEAARGKYIALCDCDDYWTDPYKLQKQVDYLESNTDCVICFHNVVNIYENDSLPRTLFNPLDFPSELTCSDMISRNWFLPTNSEVFRHEFLSFPEWYDSVLHVDYVINLIISQYGRIHYLPDIMAVYRHTSASVSNLCGGNGYDYLLFHSKTMQRILVYMKESLNPKYLPEINKRISYYDSEIKLYSKEVFYQSHPLQRLFRIKTYKRIIKRILSKNDS